MTKKKETKGAAEQRVTVEVIMPATSAKEAEAVAAKYFDDLQNKGCIKGWSPATSAPEPGEPMSPETITRQIESALRSARWVNEAGLEVAVERTGELAAGGDTDIGFTIFFEDGAHVALVLRQNGAGK